jgi:hypothetical protein
MEEAPAQASTATPKLRWETSLTEHVRGLALSPDGEYLAATTEKGVALLATSGQLLWEKDYSAISRWISYPKYQGAIPPLVVVPKGQWMAVAGDSGYRYVWVLDKQGRKQWYVKTTGTPQALAVTRKGDLLAIGTAAGHICLVSPQGKVLGDIEVRGVVGGLNWARQVMGGLAFSEDGTHLLITWGIGTVGLLSRAGKIMFAREPGGLTVMTLSMSRDLRWFLMVKKLSYSPLPERIELISQTGESLWEKELYGAEALISPDGSYIVAAGWLKPFGELAEGDLPRLLILDR